MEWPFAARLLVTRDREKRMFAVRRLSMSANDLQWVIHDAQLLVGLSSLAMNLGPGLLPDGA